MTASRAQSETGTLAPYVPEALLARLARPIEVLSETVECTMVFADVSGFTRLSERLARRGEEGAEHLVDAINTCFTALLAEAYARGGSLIKFGGDAMLLLFYDQEGDQQHVQRACSAAAAMRRSLRKVGRISTGESNVVLRMSVGVHAGPYAMFVVGASHREFLVAGPAASTLVAMEAAAASGQILISVDTARLLPRSSVGGAVGPGFLLARSPAAREWVPPGGLPTPSEDVVASFIPAMVRAHLLSGSAVAEHRTATIAFLQFGSLDDVLARDGLAGAAGRLDELVRLVQEACDRYEVCFLDSDIALNGGKIRLSAGAPRVVGDDEERMLLVLRHIVEAGPPLPLGAGVHRGPVFTSPVGPPYRRWYAVMGDTVNLAARLVAKTPPGHIYATREVLRGAKTSFEQTPLAPFAVKGKSRPVQAWDAGPPVRGASDAAIRMEVPLVGRAAELEQLRSAIERARHGSGSLIELVGQTGSGKSRLMAEAVSFAHGMVHLRVTCEVYTRDAPYHAWRGPLRALLGLGGDEPESTVADRLRAELESVDPGLLPWVSLLAIVFDVEIAPSVEVEQLAPMSRPAKLHEVVLRFLGRALVVPTIVQIEQAHLMDAASAALFEALVRELESSAWIVLLTRRDVPGGFALPSGAHGRIELGPLPIDDVRALALTTPEAARVPPHVLELAVQRCGGSPEFLLDLLAAAVAGDRDGLPDSIGAATMARIDALDPEDRDLVRRAAVLGLSFDPRRLADVIGPDLPVPADRDWERLSSVFALEFGGRMRFRQPALQEVAYSSLPFKLRRELHRAIGLRLETERTSTRPMPPCSRITSRWPAIMCARNATRSPRPSGRPSGSHMRTRRGCTGGRSKPHERAGRTTITGRSARRGSNSGRRCGQSASRRRLPGHSARRAGSCKMIRLPRPGYATGRREVAKRSAALTAAVRWLKRGFRSIEALDDAEAIAWRARLRSSLGGIRSRQGRWTETISVCRQAISEASEVGELRALAHACYVLDWALVETGRDADAIKRRTRAGDLSSAPRPRARVDGSEQPRHARLLQRPLGTGHRVVPQRG